MKHENLGLGMLVGGAVGLGFGVGVCHVFCGWWFYQMEKMLVWGVSAEVG